MIGKAYSRAVCGLLLVTESLYGYIRSQAYICHLITTANDVDQNVEERTNEVIKSGKMSVLY